MQNKKIELLVLQLDKIEKEKAESLALGTCILSHNNYCSVLLYLSIIISNDNILLLFLQLLRIKNKSLRK